MSYLYDFFLYPFQSHNPINETQHVHHRHHHHHPHDLYIRIIMYNYYTHHKLKLGIVGVSQCLERVNGDSIFHSTNLFPSYKIKHNCTRNVRYIFLSNHVNLFQTLTSKICKEISFKRGIQTTFGVNAPSLIYKYFFLFFCKKTKMFLNPLLNSKKCIFVLFSSSSSLRQSPIIRGNIPYFEINYKIHTLSKTTTTFSSSYCLQICKIIFLWLFFFSFEHHYYYPFFGCSSHKTAARGDHVSMR